MLRASSATLSTTPAADPLGEVFLRIEETLAALHLAALSLPSQLYGSWDPAAYEELPGLRSRAAGTEEALRRLLGTYDHVAGTSPTLANDPLASGDRPELLESSLAGELTEIYEDVDEALALLDAHGQSPAVLWELSFAFENHWGRHVMWALPPLFELNRPPAATRRPIRLATAP